MVIAIGIAAAAQVFMPIAFALAAGFPFVAIGIYAAWRQRGIPGETKTAEIIEAVMALSREELAAVVEDAFRREAYSVTAFEEDAADWVARKGATTTVVACRRWKMAQVGVGPLKELREAARTLGASGRAFLTCGEVSATARRYAEDNGVEIIEGASLAKLLARSLKARAK